MLVEGFLKNLNESLRGNAEARIDGVALASIASAHHIE
jgi:hypothetical protein